MRTKAEFQARRAKKCRHFRSIMEGGSCHAGVVYKSLGTHGQWPCHGDIGDDVSFCEKYEPYTADEIAESEARINEGINMMAKALLIIKDIKGGGGIIECPRCRADLQWSRAGNNGHVHGQCSTPGCLCWMQ